MTNEWALYSSVCSRLPLTHLLVSLLPWCVNQSAKSRNQFQQKSRTREKGDFLLVQGDISWTPRGMGLDVSERLRLRLFGKTSSSPTPISASLSVPPFFFSLWSFSHGSRIRRGNQLASFSRLSCPNHVPFDYSCKGEDSRVQRQGIFCPDYLGVESESVEASQKKDAGRKNQCTCCSCSLIFLPVS